MAFAIQFVIDVLSLGGAYALMALASSSSTASCAS